MADEVTGSSLSFDELLPSEDDQAVLDQAKKLAKDILSKTPDQMRIDEKALLMTAFCTDVYSRESTDTSLAVGLSVASPSSSDSQEDIGSIDREGSPVSNDTQQDAILQAIRVELLDLEGQADPKHESTYAYYKIMRPKNRPNVAIFVAKGTDSSFDWTGQNIWVNGRLSNLSPHLLESVLGLLQHFIPRNDQPTHYWLTGHSLAGHLVQELSAMMYGLSHCDNSNSLFQYILHALSKSDSKEYTPDELQSYAAALWSKINVVWAVDPPGTHHIIKSLFSSDFRLDEDLQRPYFDTLPNTHMTLVGRVNLINRIGQQLVDPYVLRTPYFDNDGGYEEYFWIQKIQQEFTTLSFNIASHGVRGMMQVLYQGNANLEQYKPHSRQPWGDGSNVYSLSRLFFLPIFGVVDRFNYIISGTMDGDQQSLQKAYEDALQVRAVTKIQAVFKGYKARREVLELRQSQAAAATKIQAVFKGYKARKEVLELRQSQVAAATKIQAVFKGYKARKEVLELRQSQAAAATKIQAVFKGYKARKELLELRQSQVAAATKIQAVFKGYKARKEVLELRQSQAERARLEAEQAERARLEAEQAERARLEEAERARLEAEQAPDREKLEVTQSDSQTGQHQGSIATTMGVIASVAVGLGLGFGLPSFVFAGSASTALFAVGSLTVTAGLLSVVGVAILSGLIVGAVSYGALSRWNRQQMHTDDRELTGTPQPTNNSCELLARRYLNDARDLANDGNNLGIDGPMVSMVLGGRS